jgi:predicted acylesterase/phospholipase RssA
MIDKQLANLIKIIDINSLVISGGGIKGFIYLGAIKLFFEYGIIDKIKYFYGTSFGGLIVTCLNLGWEMDEAFKFALNFPLDCIIDYDIDNFFDNYGLVSKKNYKTLFKKIISFKGFDENITFDELYKKTSKELHLITYSLKKNKCIDLNYESTPTLKIWEGLYMTTALPILISPYEYGDDIYIDGGILENFPLSRVKPENINKTIGICTDSYKINYDLLRKNFVNKDLLKHIEYLLELIKVVFGATQFYDTNNYITLYFDNESEYANTFDYSINNKNRKKLINCGYNQSIKQFECIIESIFKKQINISKKIIGSKYHEV